MVVFVSESGELLCSVKKLQLLAFSLAQSMIAIGLFLSLLLVKINRARGSFPVPASPKITSGALLSAYSSIDIPK